MRTIIHDLNSKDLKKFNFNEDDKLISSLECEHNCVGCFSCWVKHPKKCFICDGFDNMAEYLKDSSELILISKCRYGCYSSSVKKVLERCIGYVLPYFTIRDNEIHHANRYEKKLKLSTYFYGDIDDEDKIALEKLVKANAINLNAYKYNITCVDNVKELIKCIL